MLDVLRWWMIIEVLGWLALPLALRLFRWLPDGGYTASKALGLLFSSYFLWLGASLGLLPNNLGGILAALILTACLSAWANVGAGLLSGRAADQRTGRPAPTLSAFLRRQAKLILASEVLFTLAFFLWAGLRAFAPDKIMNAGGEKFMEIAFLNGILNSPSFPPIDPWLSGFSISYYYFGYVMMALVTRLSGVLPTVGFDLYDALLFALTALGAFGVVYNLVALGQRRLERSEKAGIPYGLLGALLAVLMANLEGVLEVLQSRGLLSPALLKWFDIPDLSNAPVTGSWNPGTVNNWWWWRGSRVIQDYNLQHQPLTGLSPITEFPFFSFLLGDNHPHVLSLPFVLLAVAFALNLLQMQLHHVGPAVSLSDGQSKPKAGWLNLLNGDWLLFFSGAILLGGLVFLNTWDFPIYLGLSLLAYLAGRSARQHSLGWADLKEAIILGAAWLVGSLVAYIFFFFSFSSQAGGIVPYIFPPTRLVQYLVMFGPFLFISTCFLFLYRAYHGISWKVVGRSWLGVSAAGALLILLVLLALVASGLLDLTSTDLRAAQEALGVDSWTAVAKQVLVDRLAEPWLFLVISALIGFSLASLFAQIFNSGSHKRPVFSSDLFVFLLIFIGLTLSWTTEFFYLRDLFSVRLNTIFKFYFQTWIMLSLASAYGIWWIANLAQQPVAQHEVAQHEVAQQPVTHPRIHTAWVSLSLTGAALLIIAGLVYPVFAANSRVAGFRGQADLDSASSLRRANTEDWAAIDWLVQNLQAGTSPRSQGVPVILEAPGESYNYEGRISAFTGFPTVLGWALHEGQWRGSYIEQDKRRPDVLTIFTTGDASKALELLRKWQVKYVIVGAAERNYIQRQCQAGGTPCNLSAALRKFDAAFETVFSEGNTKIYLVP